MKKLFLLMTCGMLAVIGVACKSPTIISTSQLSTPETSSIWWTTWLTQPTCKVPCWQGITLGVTTKDEAVAILKEMPYTIITYNVRDAVEWDFETNQTGGWLRTENGIVTSIVLGSTYDSLTLETVVTSYGYPNFVVPEDCRDGMCSTILVYSDIGMWLDAFAENKGWNSDTIKVEILPDTIVNRVTFTGQGMEKFKQSYLTSEYNTPIMDWKEYGNYP